MLKRTQISTAALIALSGTLLGQTAYAQQTGERIEVTGTRIKTTQTETTSPVVSLTAEQIKTEAVRNVETLLNNLPQAVADYGAQVSNGSTGTASVDLRGIGPQRTLVLMNGRRMPGGSPGTPGTPASASAADLNQIPIALVKRVDVLTGGASAIYGADAVSGVVNFIMNDSFEGLQLELNHQFYNHQQNNPKDVNAALNARRFAIPGDKDADGQVTDFSITVGGNFAGGKGNATAFFGFKREKALLQSERDFSSCSLGAAGNAFTCAGSSTSFPGRFITDNGSVTVADAAGNTRPWSSATDLYNFGPLNYFQRPSDRFTVATFARYNISDMARTYLEANFHDDKTLAQIAPSGLFGFDASGPNAVRFENPLLSPAWRAALGLTRPGDTADVLILRRNVEGGGRQDDIRHTSFRVVTGVKGDIGAFSYDAFVQTGRVAYQESYLNDFSNTRSARALDVVTDPATGRAVCRSVLDGTDPNCVPYNIWRLGGVTPEALSYLQTPGVKRGSTQQNIVGASVGIDLGKFGLKLPTAQDPVEAVVGVERRLEKLDLVTDTAFTSGDLAGQGGPTKGVKGQYTVKEAYTELRVPFVKNKPGAHSLDLTASYRYSDYSIGATTDTWGLGLAYAPIAAVKLRGSVQRAVRAPNMFELFGASGLGLFNLDADPCAGARPAFTREQCARTGVSAAQYGSVIDNPAGQYNQLVGGNPNLKPETADSLTLGVVLQPTRDLDVTIDYYDIEVKDVVGTVPPDTTLTQCANTGNPLFCGKIHRDSRGTLWATPQAFIEANNANLARIRAVGFDIGANYRLRLGGMGSLDLGFIGTRVRKLETESVVGLGTYDCAGLFGAGTCLKPTPKWRHKLRTGWTTPWGVDLALTWRYIGETKDEVTSSNPLLTGTVQPVQEKNGPVNYFDIAAKYNLTKNLTLRAAINNLFDKDPPLSASGAPFGNGNTYPVVYDALGRKISLGVTATF